ncbi:hypothetical protein GCM10010439_54410 [Actinocorallia aurantiaca]|jgi:hypothetical protein|uniref:Uncharacterized protein n=1 Tax=Actinocorallia aurantiaca TaxID=46204 RepID=A0ABP6H0S7_9ACTN
MNRPPAEGAAMTSTARWVVAQRRKRLVITQTLRDRAQTDPRRAARREAALAES